jgi:Flp pilus assembly protein TadD
MKENYRDAPHRHEDDPKRPKSPSSEGEKDSKVSTITVDTEIQENPKGQSGKEHIAKDDSLQKNEIDLSYASQGANLVGDKGETGPEGERERILIQSPTEAILEAETKPFKESPPKGKFKTVSPEKGKRHPRKTKADELGKADSGVERKTKGRRSPKKAKPRISKPSPEQVIMSKGVAYLEGNRIRMAGGIKLRPGDQIKIGEKEFILKAGEKKRKLPYLVIFLLLVIAILISSQLLKGKSSGKLIGIVLQEKSNISLSNAEIQIAELGKKVRANQLGFFMFDMVPPGSYTLLTSLKGYQTVEDKATITKKQTTTLTISLSPERLTELSDKSSEEIISMTPASEGEKAQNKYGAIKIESNVSDPLIMVDGQKWGKGNKVYNNIYMGRHTVTIRKEGYQDWTEKVEVDRGKTVKLNINLLEEDADREAHQTSEDWIALAQTQANSHDFSEAINSYSLALTTDPKSPEALMGRGLAYVQLDDKSKALEDLSEAAKYYNREREYSKAVICYTNLLGLNEQDLESFYNRGLCYLKLRQYEKSISDFEKTIEMNKEFFSGYLNLGEAYYNSGNYEASIENYKKAKKLNSHSQQVYVGLAKSYFAKGKISSAKKNYKRFEELSTYIDREKMKQDPEWRELLKGIGEKADPEF